MSKLPEEKINDCIRNHLLYTRPAGTTLSHKLAVNGHHYAVFVSWTVAPIDPRSPHAPLGYLWVVTRREPNGAELYIHYERGYIWKKGNSKTALTNRDVAAVMRTLSQGV